MSETRALLIRLEARRKILRAHLDMLLEAEARGEGLDSVQIDFLHSEMEFLADLYRTLELSLVRADLTEGKTP